MNLAALMTSKNGHYITPPQIIGPLHRMLRIKHEHECHAVGAKPLTGVVPFFDPYSNDASQTGAKWSCDITKGQDGNAADWSARKRPHADKAFVFKNPEYGQAIALAMATTHRFGRELESCEIISLLPNRPDTQWCQRYVFGSADAWIHIEGRLTFWKMIPIDDPRPWKDRKSPKDPKDQPYFLRRWFTDASDESLPKPFRLLAPGFAIGPELGSNGQPQAAPFPSLLPYWGDDIGLFAKCFGSLGTLTIARGSRLPPAPSADVLASCPAEVRQWVEQAAARKSGVYQRSGR